MQLRNNWPLSYLRRGRAFAGGVSGPIRFVGSGTYLQDGQSVGSGPTFNFSSLLDELGATPSIEEFDFAIVSWVTHNGVDLTPTAPSGWDKPVDIYISGGQKTNLAVFTKLLDGSETGVTLPISGNSQNALSGAVGVFRGVNITNPLDVAIQTATGTGTGRPNPAAITPATAGSWPVVVCGSALAATGVYTNPGDLSATANHFRTVTSPDSNPCTAGIGLKTDWTSGAFDPAQWGGAGNLSFESWAAATLALRSA